MASPDADTPTRPRSDSSAGKETLKEKIARAKREAELAADSTSEVNASFATPVAANPNAERPRADNSAGRETLKERIARQKSEAELAGKSQNADTLAALPPSPIQSAVIGGLAVRRGSTAFLRSIQKTSSNGASASDFC